MSTQTRVEQGNPTAVPIESSGSDRDPGKMQTFAKGSAALNGLTGNPFGRNNEYLPERLQEALRRLVVQFSTESESTRRQEIRRIKQAHQFWRGLQYLWWNERDQNWHLPFQEKLLDNSALDTMPRYEFVTNIYQAFGLSLVSVLSQDVPRVRFFPTSAQAEEDVSAAKAATEVAQLIERNNRIGNLIVDQAFHLWTDGKVGAYVRYVVDGQRFGFHPEREIGERQIEIGADRYVCPECGGETSGKDEATGRASNTAEAVRQADGDTADLIVVNCAQCGALLTEEDFVAAESITVPVEEAALRVPNGQEVVSIVGGLELKTPPWANEMHEYPYLQWNMEVHMARLRAAYPHAADKIRTAGCEWSARIRAPGQTRTVAGRAADRRRRLQHQPDHVSKDMVETVGVFLVG